LDRRRQTRSTAAYDSEPRRVRESAEAEIAGYIAQLTAEMMIMASKTHLDLLAYLLSMARDEAELIARRNAAE
jgi:hypothetical protein